MVDRKTSVFQRTGDVSATQEGHLHVQVRQGRRLLSADGNPCNAYCQVTLRPLRGVKGERTPSIPNTNDPNWNHTVSCIIRVHVVYNVHVQYSVHYIRGDRLR